MWPKWTTLKKLVWFHILKGVAAILETVTGTAPIALTDAIAHALISLTQTGKCEQASTPTPTTPVDIYCNNGKLVARRQSGLPTGYKLIESMTLNNNCYYEITDFPMYGSDTLKFSFSIMADCNVIGAYSGSVSGDNYSLYCVTQTGNYLRYGSGAYRSALNSYTRYNASITPTGSHGLLFNSTWSELTFTTPTNLCIGSTSTTTTAAKFRGTFYGAVEVVGRAKFLPCERSSDGVVGWYDLYSNTFYEPVSGSTNPIKGSYVDDPVEVVVVGTDEVLTVSASGAENQTASVVDLLSAGDTADTQEIIHGTVTHKVGIKVMDGTENWGAGSAGTGYRKFSLEIPDLIPDGGSAASGFCSHYKWEYANTVGNFYFAASGSVLQIVEESSTSLSAFKTFLAAQFNASTPVIIIYPLATPTTEDVTPQALTTSAGDNTISVTAEVSGIELEAEYRKTAA